MKRLLCAAICSVSAILFAAGCASEREQNIRRYDAMHQDVRQAPADQPKKWEMNPGSK